MAPIAATVSTAATEAIQHLNASTQNSTDSLGPHEAMSAFSNPFTTGIQIVQTIALGALLVLVCLTLFHCREQSKAAAAAAAKSAQDPLSDTRDLLLGLKARLMDVGDAIERVEALMHDGGAGMRAGACCVKGQGVYVEEKGDCGLWMPRDGVGGWEDDVLKRLRAIRGSWL